MADLASAVDKMRNRAISLAARGPGAVQVETIHNIEAVRRLRACHGALTVEERHGVDTAIEALEERLFGIVEANGPDQFTVEERNAIRVRHPINSPVSEHNRIIREWNDMTAAIGGPAPLPAPRELINAAEAWLVATITADRVDQKISDLLAPWENATVTPPPRPEVRFRT